MHENGNVGVGLDVPAQKLHVVGKRIRLENSGKTLDLRADGTMVDIESTTSSIFVSSIGAGHHVVINPDTEDGNVGIGTAGPTLGKLQVSTSTGSFDAIRIIKAGSDGIEIGDGTNYPLYGLYISSPGTSNNAVWVNTANPAGQWGVYTPDKIYAANVTLNSVTLMAVVDGNFELTRGDIVAAVGFVPSAMDDLKPLAKVALATNSDAGVIGVVESRMALVPEPDKADENPPPLVLRSVPGSATVGDYVAITIAGVAQVKVDAATAPIVAGQRLTSAQTPEQARALRSASLDGMIVAEGAPIIGVALEPLAAGQGLIWVLVNPQ